MPAAIPPAEIAAVVAPGALRERSQPTLSVDELTIRPWRASDAPAVRAAYGDPDIQHWHRLSLTDAEAMTWVLSWAELWAAETDAVWAVTEDGELVGRVGVRRLFLEDGSGQANYWVVPAARGRNIAPRALTTVTDWLFDQLGFHRIELFHSIRNLASCRVATKAGYRTEGTLRQHGLHADGWHDVHLHARVRD